MSNDDINEYIPSVLNPRRIKKRIGDLTQNSIISRCSLSLKKNNSSLSWDKRIKKVYSKNKENFQSTQNINIENTSLPSTKILSCESNIQVESVNFSTIKDLTAEKDNSKLDFPDNYNNFATIKDLTAEKDNSKFDFPDNFNNFSTIKNLTDEKNPKYDFPDNSNTYNDHLAFTDCNKNQTNLQFNRSYITKSSNTDIDEHSKEDKVTESTIFDHLRNPVFSIGIGITNCENIKLSTKNTNIKTIELACKDNIINLECELIETSQISTESEVEDINMDVFNGITPLKRSAIVDVNLEIKKKKVSNTEDCTENSKILILKSNAIEKLSHVIVQPLNYKIVKNLILGKSKFQTQKAVRSSKKNGKKSSCGANLSQKLIDSYLVKNDNVIKLTDERTVVGNDDVIKNNCRTADVRDDAQDMSKNPGVTEVVKIDRVGKAKHRSSCRDNDNLSPKSAKILSRRCNDSPKIQDIKTSKSDAPRSISPKGKADGVGSHSPKKNIDSVQFTLTTKAKSNKTSANTKNIPYFKIVAGTHFAVDAFSYGDIPNVKHYFLTHFHSDHYSGLKKTFNKLLFCSKITAELCISRLGVNAKCIHILNVNETMLVEEVEVTAVDANHCPGAIMLVFTLPNGKTILHTGDFRASPAMESYPIFWNKDIHTIYLDTTYCNPRYDFPTQDQSLEMALHLLRQKKMVLEKAGKKFASVLIVCGTYTIGKEKFFMGMARRVGCAVWACPEKDRVLQAVEGRSFGRAPPHACQLHVVPMRDLTTEKLRSYLDSLEGAFSEVVAFKPSGWENGKTAAVEKDLVTIHGIPYSEHSSFSEIIRFVNYLKPKQVVPTVDISGGIKAVQKFFPCPLVCKEDIQCQSRMTDFFSIQGRQQVPAVT